MMLEIYLFIIKPQLKNMWSPVHGRLAVQAGGTEGGCQGQYQWRGSRSKLGTRAPSQAKASATIYLTLQLLLQDK